MAKRARRFVRRHFLPTGHSGRGTKTFLIRLSLMRFPQCVCKIRIRNSPTYTHTEQEKTPLIIRWHNLYVQIVRLVFYLPGDEHFYFSFNILIRRYACGPLTLEEIHQVNLKL